MPNTPSAAGNRYRLPWYVVGPIVAVSAAEVGTFLGWRGAVGLMVGSIATSLLLWRNDGS